MERLSGRPRTLLSIALLTTGLVSACGEETAAPPAPAATETAAPAPPAVAGPSIPELVSRLHHGLDVSDHSGAVDWPQLASEGHTFAFVKATEGVDLKDAAFDAHWPAIKEAGLIRGAYHFYVTEDDPQEQARFFIDNVELEPGDLAPVVDVELIGHDTLPGLPERLQLWLDTVEQRYGVKPIIYTSPKFWDTHLVDHFGGYPLWVAEYDVEQPQLPLGWQVWHLWQWQGDATVSGVEKGADLSHVNRSGADLSRLIVPHGEAGAASEGAATPEQP